MRLNVARRHAARIHRQNLVVEALKAPLVFRQNLWLEAAVAVTCHFDLHRAEITLHCLAALAVAIIAAPPAIAVVFLHSRGGWKAQLPWPVPAAPSSVASAPLPAPQSLPPTSPSAAHPTLRPSCSSLPSAFSFSLRKTPFTKNVLPPRLPCGRRSMCCKEPPLPSAIPATVTRSSC